MSKQKHSEKKPKDDGTLKQLMLSRTEAVAALVKQYGDVNRPLIEGILNLADANALELSKKAEESHREEMNKLAVDTGTVRRLADNVALAEKRTGELVTKAERVPGLADKAVRDIITLTVTETTEGKGIVQTEMTGAALMSYFYKEIKAVRELYSKSTTEVPTAEDLIKIISPALDKELIMPFEAILEDFERNMGAYKKEVVGSVTNIVEGLKRRLEAAEKNAASAQKQLKQVYEALQTALGADLGGAGYVGLVTLRDATPEVLAALQHDKDYHAAVSETVVKFGLENVRTILGDFKEDPSIVSQMLHDQKMSELGVDAETYSQPGYREIREYLGSWTGVIATRSDAALEMLNSSQSSGAGTKTEAV